MKPRTETSAYPALLVRLILERDWRRCGPWLKHATAVGGPPGPGLLAHRAGDEECDEGDSGETADDDTGELDVSFVRTGSKRDEERRGIDSGEVIGKNTTYSSNA